MKAYAVRATVPTSWPSRRSTFVTLGRYLNLRTLSIPASAFAKAASGNRAARLFRARSRIATAPRRVSSWLARAASHAAWNTISVTPNTCGALAILAFFMSCSPFTFCRGIARAAEAGALLHDAGHMISHRGHHKHGEYLALNEIFRVSRAGTSVVAR